MEKPPGLSTWLPEEKRTTIWYLWVERFWCRIPYIQTMSVDYIKHFGMPTTGDPDRDKDTANHLVDKMLCIAEMVKYYSEGADLRVKNQSDCVRIHELANNHLVAWKRKLETALTIGDAPIEDLILLDQFANVVYNKHAKYHFDRPFVDSLLARQTDKILTVNLDSVLTPKRKIVSVTPEQEAEKYPDRPGMSDFFKEIIPHPPVTKWR